MPTAELGGTRLSWAERERGDVVLFLHGFPFDARLWAPQLAALPAGWRGIAPDLRGFGRSASPAARTVDAHAGDALALLDHLGIGRCVVCGLSMGGYIAFALQRRAPERVRALVLADTRAEPDTDEARRQRMTQAAGVRAEGTAAFVTGTLPRLLSERTRAERPDVAQLVERMMRETPAETMATTLAALAERPDARPQLPHIRVPTLVIGGREDAITPPATLADLARAISGARLELLAGAGHVAALEADAEFNAALIDFLEGLRD